VNRAQRDRRIVLTPRYCALLNLDTFAAMTKERPDAVFILADLMRARQAK
jgi:hypothetical protein